MDNDDIDRNLLFGVLAFQNHLIDHRALIDAIREWSAERRRPLAKILLVRGALAAEEAPLVDLLVSRHLKKHAGRANETLGAVAGPAALAALRGVDAPEVRKSLDALPPPPAPAGETLIRPAGERSRHTLTRVLGQGGLGRVWVARDAELNREVALKEILDENARHPEAVRRFCKEAQITGQLEHPNVVPVHELARRPEDDQPYYTMRLVAGRTLAEAIAAQHARRAAGAVDPQGRFELLQAFLGVCQGVGYAHSRGVIHRDLKPLNVMLGDFGEAVVIDWGLAKLVGQPDEPSEVNLTDEADHPKTQFGHLKGSPSYMAPEQAEGRPELVDRRTDVYGLGAVLFEILTGRPPYVGNDVHQVLAQVLKGEPLRARGLDRTIPPALDAICSRATARDRASRYESATELALEIRRWMADEPVSAYREPAVERLARWARRHRSWVQAGAAALLVVAIVSVAAVTRERARVLRLRIDAQDLVFGAQADVAADRPGEAVVKLAGALGRLKGEPALADLKARADRLIAQANAALDARAARARSQERLGRFRRSHDEALFRATMYLGMKSDPAGAELSSPSALAAASAKEAFRLYSLDADAATGAAAADPWLSADEAAEVADLVDELFLLLAEVEASSGPSGGDGVEPARRALALIDRAASFGHRRRAYHAQRARLLARLGDAAGAEAEASKAAAVAPSGAFERFLSGEDAYRRGDLAAALGHLEAALRLRPDHFWAQYLTALCLLKQGRAAEARANLTSCLGHRQADPAWCLILRGYADGLLKDYDAAEDDFAAALTPRPDAVACYGALVNRGMVRLLRGRNAEAVADLKEAVGVLPDRHEARINLAYAYQMRGDRIAALTELDTAARLAPRLATAYRNRARLRLEMGDEAGALGDFREAIRHEPGRARERAEDGTDLAAIHFRAGRLDEAVGACDEALAAVADYPLALRLKAEALIARKDDARAVALLDRYLERGEPVADVYRARGLLRQELGKLDGALEDFTQALKMEPDSCDILTKRGWIFTLNALELARRDFDRAIHLNPRNGDAFNGRGFAAVRLGDAASGVADAEEAARLAPHEPVMLFNAACVFGEAAGSPAPAPQAKADEYRRRALDLLRDALQSTPPGDRRAFWARNVEADPALDSIRQDEGFAALKAAIARDSK